MSLSALIELCLRSRLKSLSSLSLSLSLCHSLSLMREVSFISLSLSLSLSLLCVRSLSSLSRALSLSLSLSLSLRCVRSLSSLFQLCLISKKAFFFVFFQHFFGFLSTFSPCENTFLKCFPKFFLLRHTLCPSLSHTQTRNFV